MTIRELEILKAALEGDIIRQKESEKANHPEWRYWLRDSEKLLRKVNRRLTEEMTKDYIRKEASNEEDNGVFFKGYKPTMYFKSK